MTDSRLLAALRATSAEAAEANPGIVIIDEPGLTGSYGAPYDPVLVHTADAELAALLARIATERARASFRVRHALPSYPAVCAALADAGFTSRGAVEVMIATAADLGDAVLPIGYQQERVTAATFELFAEHVSTVMEQARSDVDQSFAVAVADHPVRGLWLARAADGLVVGAVAALTAGSAVLVCVVTTVSAYRGQGIGGALALAAARRGLGGGAGFAMLSATPAGKGVYERVGFRVVDTWEVFDDATGH